MNSSHTIVKTPPTYSHIVCVVLLATAITTAGIGFSTGSKKMGRHEFAGGFRPMVWQHITVRKLLATP